MSRSRLLGLLLTFVFLGLALRGVDPSELAHELAQFNYLWLMPSAACTLGGYLLRTARWRVILSGAARAPFRTLFAVLVMGFATNNLLPGRLGEFWRAYLLGRKRNVRKTFALASVFVERVFDGLVLLGLLAGMSLFVRLPVWTEKVQVVAALIFLGATAGLTFVLIRPDVATRIIRRLLTPAPLRLRTWAVGAFAAFLDGLLVLRRPAVLLQAAVLSIGVWLLEGASYFLLSLGIPLGLSPESRLPAMALTLVTINLGIMVPSAPGYVGTQEFFGTAALGSFGVNYEAALALVLVSHAVQYVLVTGLGLLFFAREHLSPRALAAMVRSSGERGAEAEPAA